MTIQKIATANYALWKAEHVMSKVSEMAGKLHINVEIGRMFDSTFEMENCSLIFLAQTSEKLLLSATELSLLLSDSPEFRA